MGPVFLSFLPFPPSLSILPLNARAMSRVSGSAKVARSKEPQSHCCIRWNTYACSGTSHITFGAFLVLDRTGPKIFVQHRKITRKSYRTTDCVLLRSLHLSQVKTHSQKYFLRLARQSVNTDKGDSGTQSDCAGHCSDSWAGNSTCARRGSPINALYTHTHTHTHTHAHTHTHI